MAAKLARELLPGDSGYGDPLSTAGSQPSQQLGRRLSTLTAQRPSLLGEIGLSALQVWDSISAQGADRGQRELTILFTDLVDFSNWSLRAGDTMAVGAAARRWGGDRASGHGTRWRRREAAGRRVDGRLR